MNDYIELRLDLKPFPGEDATDLLAGLLGDAGFESFVPDSEGLTAYAAVANFSDEKVTEALEDFPYDCEVNISKALVEGRDWNAEWERNYFQPIVVGGECVVHSSFHTDVPAATYDIVIDPKMAFGTGHHATTSQMLRRILASDFNGKTVIDMGTGTGILAILAAMRGAAGVTGIEIDEFAYTNAIENVALNSHPEIRLINGDASALSSLDPADFFIANINRNVITADMAAYAAALKPGGEMFLSGFYTEDVPIVEEAGRTFGLTSAGFTQEDNWACLKLVKS